MSADIRLSVDFLAHHKTLKLKRKLGNEAVLALIGLFCYAGKFRSGGALAGLDAEDIADASGWAGGDAQSYVSTLCEVGFLEKREEGIYSIHDWAKHQPWVAGAEDRKAAASKAGKASAEARKKTCNISQDPTEFNGPLESVERVLNDPFNRPSTPSPSPSPSPLPKGIKTPPEKATAFSSPQGGERHPTKRFVPPTLAEITAYCEERKNGIDPQAVLDHYTANGWKVGKNPMRDWRAAVRTWEAKRRTETTPQRSAKPLSPAEKLLAESNGGTRQ